jgi:hypothetical protein
MNWYKKIVLSTRPLALTSREMAILLNSLGLYSSEGTNHRIYKHENVDGFISLPRHRGPLHPSVIRDIYRKMGLNSSQFKSILQTDKKEQKYLWEQIVNKDIPLEEEPISSQNPYEKFKKELIEMMRKGYDVSGVSNNLRNKFPNGIADQHIINPAYSEV